MWSLGKFWTTLDPIYEINEETGIINRLYPLAREIHLNAKSIYILVTEICEWKFKVNIVRNTIFEEN